MMSCISIQAELFRKRACNGHAKLINKLAAAAVQDLPLFISQLGRFLERFNSDYLKSDEMEELQEDTPQLFFTVSGISKRLQNIKELLLAFYNTDDVRDLSRYSKEINQEAVNINEDMDNINKSNSEIFIFEDARVDDLIEQVLIKVAEFLIIKGNEKEIYSDNLNEKEDPDEDEEPEYISEDPKENTLTPEQREYQNKKLIEKEFKNLTPQQTINLKEMNRQNEKALERFKSWYAKNKNNPKFREKEKNRIRLYREQNTSAVANQAEHTKKYRNKVMSIINKFKEIRKSYLYLENLRKTPKQLEEFKQDNSTEYQKILSDYVRYKKLLESPEEYNKVMNIVNSYEERKKKNVEVARIRRQKKREELMAGKG